MMTNASLSIKDFLQERHLTRKDVNLSSAETRMRLEKSQLLERMRDICAAINTEARRVIVEGHHYLPPEPVIESFTFVKNETEYVMRVELWGTKPSLVFITRKWRDSNRFVRWVYRLLELEPVRVNIRFSREIDEANTSRQQIKGWFFYLLSGLNRSYAPSLQCDNELPDNDGRE